MKLFYSTASPFVRKVMVLAHETQLISRISLVHAVVNPINRALEVAAHNPSGHIPTLLLDDGTALFDSVVICQYLDTLHLQPRLHPTEPLPLARALCLQSLADGILDAGVLLRYETVLRPAALRWTDWEQGQWSKILSSLNTLSATGLPSLQDSLNIGVIAVGCALGYLDFRFPQFDWRNNHPGLAHWYLAFEQRPSMQATQLRQLT
ncbi:MAG: glutathione S-transferase [Burkholderiaceae bacterium]|nr:glutathione S-transferase [Burkholderiaceae bacterium]